METQIALVDSAILDRYLETGSRKVLTSDTLLAICVCLHSLIGPEVYKHAGLKRSFIPL